MLSAQWVRISFRSLLLSAGDGSPWLPQPEKKKRTVTKKNNRIALILKNSKWIDNNAVNPLGKFFEILQPELCFDGIGRGVNLGGVEIPEAIGGSDQVIEDVV